MDRLNSLRTSSLKHSTDSFRFNPFIPPSIRARPDGMEWLNWNGTTFWINLPINYDSHSHPQLWPVTHGNHINENFLHGCNVNQRNGLSRPSTTTQEERPSTRLYWVDASQEHLRVLNVCADCVQSITQLKCEKPTNVSSNVVPQCQKGATRHIWNTFSRAYFLLRIIDNYWCSPWYRKSSQHQTVRADAERRQVHGT